uniref:Uncharacterized protein n=1 Tax=Molossus molossus TaxID=27622 RepID=A0A7J8HIQ5_MOLMO|nr:hypothetical protein HJG59_010943 [Molossus molossus]
MSLKSFGDVARPFLRPGLLVYFPAPPAPRDHAPFSTPWSHFSLPPPRSVTSHLLTLRHLLAWPFPLLMESDPSSEVSPAPPSSRRTPAGPRGMCPLWGSHTSDSPEPCSAAGWAGWAEQRGQTHGPGTNTGQCIYTFAPTFKN